MGKPGSKLSAKERIGYEVFFFTAVYGLYNVFYSNPVVVDAAVFTALFGTMFVRYHLVVSGEELSDSRVAKWTGNALLVVGVTIPSHLIYRYLRAAIGEFGGVTSQVLTLAGSGVVAVSLLAVANHRVFRYDEQRQETFKQEIGEGGVTDLVSRVGLFFDRHAFRSDYGRDGIQSELFEEYRKVGDKVRKGEIQTVNKHRVRRIVKRSQDVFHILTVATHVFVSVTILLLFVGMAEVFRSIETVEMLAVILVVASVFYSFVLLHLRFGVRREISRSFWMMPAELVLCILVTFAALSNAELIGGEAVIVMIPFTVYLLSDWSKLLTQKVVMKVMMSQVDLSDEHRAVIRDALKDDEEE